MSSTTTHINSRKITFKRKVSFAEGVQDKAPDFMSMSKRSIGSYLESKDSHAVGSGLSFAERDLLMPYLIDLPKTDRDFMNKSRSFFESISTKVGYEDGVTLETGLELDNDKPVTFFDEKTERYNIPINVMDYVRYRHAIKHPRVAMSETEAMSNPLVDFYLYDPTEVVATAGKVNKAKDDALQNYLKIKDDMKKVDAMLTLLKIDPRSYHGVNGDDQKTQKLRELADEQAITFNNIYVDKMFEQKYKLQTLLNGGIIIRVGNQYIFKETSKILANNEQEMLFFFTDPVNSATVVILESQMQETLKQKVAKSTPKNRTPVGR